jgi:membrane fusion protein, macrolide-specific efflux system
MGELPNHQHRYIRNNRLKILISTITCFILLPLSACSFLPKEEPTLAPPLVEPAKIQYDVVAVKRGDLINRIKGVGSLTPINHHNLFYPNTGGRMKELHVKEGDTVKEGQILVELETGNLTFDLQQAEIDLQKAELHLKQLQKQKADSFSIEMAKLDVKSVKLRVQHFREQQSKSQLISPLNGIVTFVGDQKAGDVIEPYQSIVQVADTKNVQLLYTATSKDELADVKIGMKADLQLKGKSFTGKIVQTPTEVPDDVLATNPDLYEKSLLISLENLPVASTIGDLVDLEVVTTHIKNTLVLPKNGLRQSMGRYYVQILDGTTKRELDIEIGLVTATEVEVLKGLSEGDKVILK